MTDGLPAVPMLPSGADRGMRGHIIQHWPHLSAPPPTEDAIVRRWVQPGPPVVSIICSVFNRATLIRDALHGFLTQQTSFPFEIVVRDDASTDGTQDIVRDYALRYPRVIRAVLLERNRYSEGIYAVHDRPGLIRGEFVALCDGDDFWIDCQKLQRQVDQLRQDPRIVMSTGGSIHIDSRTGSLRRVGEVDSEIIYPRMATRHHHTSTYVIRSAPYVEVIRRSLIPNSLYGDTPVRWLLTQYGRIAAVPGALSVRWNDGTGIWTSKSSTVRAEIHVQLYARLFWIMPWRARLSVLRELSWSARGLVELRHSAVESEASSPSEPGHGCRSRRWVQRSRSVAVVAKALLRAGARH